MANAQPLMSAQIQTKTKTDISQALLMGLMVLTGTMVLGVFSGLAAIALERLYVGQGIKYEAYSFGDMGEYGVIYNLDYSSNKYHRIYTKNNYSSPWPVIIAKPLSYLGTQPSHVRIVGMGYDSIKKKNFIDLKLEEWVYLDKFHTKETVSILILKQGAYQDTSLGFQMEVGTVNNVKSWPKGGTASWSNAYFKKPFSVAPVVLSQTQFYSEGDEPVTTRHYTVAKDKFVLRLQEEEAKGDHAATTVGYVAIAPINTTMTGKGNFKIDANNNYSVNNQLKTIVFRQNFGEQPIFLADIQSFKDWDTADLRYQNLYNDSVQVKVEEEQSSDTETTHAYETVGYLALQRSTPMYCGNAIIETGEDCDDGGNVNGDGCSAACTNEISLSLIPNVIHAKQDFTAQVDTSLNTGTVKICDGAGYNISGCLGDTVCSFDLAQTNSCLITTEDLDTNMNGYTYWAGLGKGKASDTILVDECIGVGGTPFGDLCYLELSGYDFSSHSGGTIAVIAQYYKELSGYQQHDYFQASYDPPITSQYDLNNDGLISVQEYLLFDLANFPGSLKDYKVIYYNGMPLLVRYIIEPFNDGSRTIKTSVLWLVSNNSERIIYTHNSITNLYEPGVTTTVTMEEQLARAFAPDGFLTQYLQYYPNILTYDPPQCGNEIIELGSEQCEADSDCPAGSSCSSCNCVAISTCTDSDGNDAATSPYISGSVIWNGVTHYDECSGSNLQVNELWCYELDGGMTMGKMVYDCSNGCSNGACHRPLTIYTPADGSVVEFTAGNDVSYILRSSPPNTSGGILAWKIDPTTPLPAGLELTPLHRIAGTPSVVGDTVVKIIVQEKNSTGVVGEGSSTFTIRIVSSSSNTCTTDSDCGAPFCAGWDCGQPTCTGDYINQKRCINGTCEGGSTGIEFCSNGCENGACI